MMWLGNEKNKSIGMESFKQFNPDWLFYFWNDETIKKLIKLHFPSYEIKFNNIDKIISKCDIARFMVLYIYGGIYIDVDFYCVRPLDELLQFDILLFREISEHEYRGGQLLNGFVGMTLGRQDCLSFIDIMFDNLESKNKNDINYVMDTTGPRALYEFFKDYDYLSGCSVTPFTNKQRISSSCDINNLMYAYTNWNEGSDWNKKNHYKKKIFILIILLVIIVGFNLNKILAFFYSYFTGRG